jgi:membrane-associated protease RseP (regulator of RpoE activity)
VGVKDTLRLVYNAGGVSLRYGLKALWALIPILTINAALIILTCFITGPEIVLNFWLQYESAIYSAILIYFLAVALIEMIIHELGHYCFQRKFGIKVLIFRIGIFNLIKKRLSSGTVFIFGIPILAAESRALGELKDKEREKHNPESFYYVKRHPKQRFIVSIAGAGAVLLICAAIIGLYLIGSVFSWLVIPPTLWFILAIVVLNELTNILIPLKIWGFPNDNWVALESLITWIKSR